jgi:hypothetical protein
MRFRAIKLVLLRRFGASYPLVLTLYGPPALVRWRSYAKTVKAVNRGSPRPKRMIIALRFSSKSLKKYPRGASATKNTTRAMNDHGHTVASRRRE